MCGRLDFAVGAGNRKLELRFAVVADKFRQL